VLENAAGLAIATSGCSDSTREYCKTADKRHRATMAVQMQLDTCQTSIKSRTDNPEALKSRPKHWQMNENARTDLKDCEGGRDQFACQVEAQLCLSCTGSICSLCIAAGSCGCSGRHWHSAEHMCMLCTGSSRRALDRHRAYIVKFQNGTPSQYCWCTKLRLYTAAYHAAQPVDQQHAPLFSMNINTVRTFLCNEITARFSSLF